MNDTGVIDQFLTVFTQYIDSGFGLLGGEVGFLSTTLIVIDVTIAALFWAWGTDEDVLSVVQRGAARVQAARPAAGMGRHLEERERMAGLHGAPTLVVAVGDAAGDAIVAGLSAEIAKMKVGPGTDNSNDMGPLVTKPHFEKVKAYVDSGVAEGATLVVDGRSVKVAGHEEGYFLGACLFDNVKPGMKIYQEEIFGPVLGVVRVKTLQEAMQLINDHEYGNGTCIFTRDGEAARYFTDHIQVGMVGVNVPLPVPVAYHSFGGWKRSLFGDLHAYGPDAVRFYTKRKTITQRWPSAGVREGAVFSFPSSR